MHQIIWQFRNFCIYSWLLFAFGFGLLSVLVLILDLDLDLDFWSWFLKIIQLFLKWSVLCFLS